MSGDAHGSQTYTSKGYDPTDVANFMNTEIARSWSPEELQNLYTAYSVTDHGNGMPAVADRGKMGFVPLDPGMDAAFRDWVQSNKQTQTNWQNYTKTINANEGGQGDNTVTSGDAVSQRNQLLGALGTLANPNATNPTPGIGDFGAILKNGKPLPPGGAK